MGAAGIALGETALRTGALHHGLPAALPSGQGSDLAGTVVELGDGSHRDVIAEVATRAATGRIEIPLAATYPLDHARDAYAQLEQRHTHGKAYL
ncbi:zinc-binding dehydrogenase [Streptomyces sp. NPDC097610]|uniref:zinc-binding dehydrogenase n=1 Tax=Streptomyces sp. NPDC097610 TaxID=3157227 RepID=UPI003319DB15